MKRLPRLCLTLSLLSSLSGTTTAIAHHSFVMFDRSRTEMLAGTVKDVELISPHGWLRILVPDLHGAQNEWSLELGGAGLLERSGWTRDAVRPGDRVVARIHPLRDGSYGGQLISVTLPDGRVLGRRSSAGF